MLNYKMPKVTPGRNYLKRYTEEDLEKAIQAVGNGMPKKTAAVKYNVPRPTLQFRLSNNFVKSRPGPSTVLTVDEETALVNWIIISSRKGFPRRREDLIKVKEKLERKDTPDTIENKEPKMKMEKKLLENIIQSDKIEPETAAKKDKYNMTREKQEYELHTERELLEEIDATEHETEENQETGRTLVIVPEKIKDKCIVNSTDKKEISNIEFILQDGDVPEPAQNLEMTAEIYKEPNRLTTYSPQPSTSREDVVFIDGKWVRIPIDEIPVTIAKESPVKKTLSQFLVLPKTPIKKGRLNQEARTFVLTSKAWEEEEIKKQNKKNEEMQTKEEKKKQRLKKAEETRLNKERKQAENLKKKVIKTESQKNKDAKNNARKPKIIQNVLIKPANENTINVQQTRHNNTRVKEEKHTDKEEMQGNDTRIHQKYIKLERKKDRKDLMPLTDKQLLNILEDNHK